ncbi:MAG: hypothetical protein N2318_06300, partial [Meiothermus sp.]|nr:hypothetical protein [Meiothermus sp.]
MRLQIRRFVEGMSWGLLGTAIVGVVLGLLRWIGLWFNLQITIMALWGFVGVWTVGLLLFLLRTVPSLSQMAQHADQRLLLNERLSTALEVVSKVPRDAIHVQIYSALIEDAAQRSKVLQPGALVQFGFPRALAYALGLGILALGLHWLPVLEAPNLSQTDALSPEEKAATLAQLERVGDLIQKDAERGNDPYLEATARSIERLKSDIQAGRLSPTALQQEIGRLTERIQRNYNLLNPSAGSAESTKAHSDFGTEIAKPVPSSQPDPQGLAPASLEQTPQKRAVQFDPIQSLNQLARALENQTQNLSQPQAPKTPPQTQKQQTDCGGEVCGDQYAMARAQQARDAEAAARALINRPQGGAAGGFGDQAGKNPGGQSGARETPLPPQPNAQQVKLPFQAPQSGRRIQIKAPPSTEGVRGAVGGEVQAQNWTQQEEVPIGLGYLESQNRSICLLYTS